MKLGICIHCLNMPLRRSLAEAAKLSVAGVQVAAVNDLSPAQLSQTGRRELLHLLRSHNLEPTALLCPLRHGLDHAENLQPRIERVEAALTMSFELGARRVIVEAGQVSNDLASPRAALLTESLRTLGQFADRVGAILALESGLDSGESMASFLARFDSGGLGVNYDPANMLTHGFDPVADLMPLKPWIVHTHAKDARSVSVSQSAQEVPLGQGDIDWMAYLGHLSALDYKGWVVVERESGESRLADITTGVNVIRRLM